MDYDRDARRFVARYRELQKALPGVEALYRLAQAVIETAAPNGGAVLVVGAGGGREIEALAASDAAFRIHGVDPSAEMLAIARSYADASPNAGAVTLQQGLVADVAPPEAGFDAATSLLVMHFLADDATPGGKAAYLADIRARLRPGAVLLLADVCFDDRDAFEALRPWFARHARLAGLSAEDAGVAPPLIAEMPIIDAARTRALLLGGGFSEPTPLFQALWYRAWVAVAV